MRSRLFTYGALVLVAILALATMAGCQREASVGAPAGVTKAPATGGAPNTAGATGQGTAVPGATDSGLISPSGKATVISLLTPLPGDASATPGASMEETVEPTVVLPTPVVVAPAATQTPVASSPEYTSYTVRPGDTLYSIASSYGVTPDAIAAASGLADPDMVIVGQVLKIPTGGTGGTQPGSGACRYHHTVKQNEWIWQIARDYGVDPNDILKANGYPSAAWASVIQPGDTLCIP